MKSPASPSSITKFVLLATMLLFVFQQLFSQNKDSLPPGWWHIPKTDASITLGGYVKFDLIQDFNPINSISFFDVSKIPTNGSEGTNTHLQVNETRLFIDFRKPMGHTQLKAYVEGDFYGSGGAFRLRHAYIDIGDKIMAGQYWSNFMDENIIPSTLDFEKPAAYAFVRHGILRFKQKVGKHSYFAIALEEPFIFIQAPTQPGKAENFVPDLTARYRYTGKWGHIQLSAFGGLIRFRPQTGSPNSIGIYGINLSGLVNFAKKDFFIYQFIAGEGVSRYRSGKTAAPDGSDQLTAIPGYGITAGVTHFWNDRWSSLAVFNYGTENNTEGQLPSDLHSIFYGAVNLKWQFHKSAFAGIEYLHGGRDDINGASGKANRLQFSIQLDINKH